MNKPLLLFRGPVETISGYGAHSRDILKSLYDIGLFDIKIDSCIWGSTPMTALDPSNNLFHLWVKNNIVTQLQTQPDFYVQITVPNEFQPLGKYNIGITAGIETNIIPKDWVIGCNKMDLIITTSNFSKTVMLSTQYPDIKPSKIEKAVKVLFEGCDTDVFKKTNQENFHDYKITKYLDNISEDFCYLFVGHWLKGNIGEDRKDVSMLIKTFGETFSKYDKKPALVLKTSAATFSVKERERISKMIRALTLGVENCPSIYLVFGELSDHEMNYMYNHPKIKTFITFTKGEGFGRPLLEFSMTGKPVIASNWSGHLDFLDGAIMLDGELADVATAAQDQFIIPGSKWFSVNYDNASKKMIDVYENYSMYQEKSKILGDNNTQNFSLNAMTEELRTIMLECLNQQKFNNDSLPKLIKSS